MLIAAGKLEQGSLSGRIVVVTGGGGGIGFEAARALRWLGARVVIAEVNKKAGQNAAQALNREFGADTALFVHTDVGSERGIARLKRQVERHWGHVDVVLNNATVAPLGAVKDTPIDTWDASYRVNLRGPALLARAFVPGMVERGSQGGQAFVCVSSVGQTYMAAYESMKAAQVHMAATLAAELEGTGVAALTIGPGFVPTQTATSAIPRLAALMNKPVDEIQALLRNVTLSVEAAGAGFAAAVAMAGRYHGQEISSTQALIDAGIEITEQAPPASTIALSVGQMDEIRALLTSVHGTLAEQSAGWKDRSIFEQQWLIRTFRQRASMPVEKWLVTLAQMQEFARANDAAGLLSVRAPLDALAGYYAYLHDMAQGYIKDQAQRERELQIVKNWQLDVERLDALLHSR